MTPVYPLPPEFARCHDESCPDCDRCKRFRWRHTFAPETRHEATLRVPGERCNDIIREGDNDIR